MSALPDVRPVTVLRTGAIDAAAPAGGRTDRARSTTSQVLLGLSVLLGWSLLYLFVLSGFEQAHHQSSLYGELRTELAEGTAPTAAPIAAGRPVALLEIPDAGVDGAVVVEGTRPAQLQQGPGHVSASVLPGQQGVSVLAGRSLSFGAPFGDIADLPRGAEITVTTGQGVFRYSVEGARLAGDPLPAPLAAGGSRLTLLTAARGGLQADQTVYVDATLVGDAVPTGAVSTPDPETRPMAVGVDVTTLALLVLALQLLVATLVGFALAWTRWSRSGAWIALAPCVLAALWLASSIGSRMLPGLI